MYTYVIPRKTYKLGRIHIPYMKIFYVFMYHIIYACMYENHIRSKTKTYVIKITWDPIMYTYIHILCNYIYLVNPEENSVFIEMYTVYTHGTTPGCARVQKWTRIKIMNFRVELSKNADVYIQTYTFYSLVHPVNAEEIVVFVKIGCHAHPGHDPRTHPQAKNENGRIQWILGSKCRKMPVCTT